MWHKTAAGRCSRIETVGYVLGASRCEYCLPLNLLLLFEYNPLLISSPLLQARSNTVDGYNYYNDAYSFCFIWIGEGSKSTVSLQKKEQNS